MQLLSGRRLASASIDAFGQTLRLWDVDKPQEPEVKPKDDKDPARRLACPESHERSFLRLCPSLAQASQSLIRRSSRRVSCHQVS